MSLKNCKIIGEGITYAVYSRQAPGVGRGHKGFIMSRLELIAFALNPEKWLSRKESGDTPATIFGRLVELLETNPTAFDSLFVVSPDTYTNKKGGESDWSRKSPDCAAWEDDKKESGLTVIKSEVKAAADAAVKPLLEYQPRAELVSCSKKQVMVVGDWHDAATKIKVPVRCLIDFVPPKEHPVWGKHLADGKTARNGEPENWARVVDDSGYDVQASLSMDLYCGATKEDRTDWTFPLSENTEPFHVVKPMPALTAEFILWGREKYQAALSRYAQCLATNVWPSYAVAGLRFGPTQLIGPDELWNYRKTGGVEMARRIEYQPKPPTADANDLLS
jgi:hypothetical protein